MEKTCTICNSTGKYKCPTCLVYYCSVQCCKKHRENECKVVVNPSRIDEDIGSTSTSCESAQIKYPSADTVPLEKLQLLNDCGKLKDLLSNPHLRGILTRINKDNDPSRIMEMAMQEPLFLEFAEVCLQTVTANHEG